MACLRDSSRTEREFLHWWRHGVLNIDGQLLSMLSLAMISKLLKCFFKLTETIYIDAKSLRI
jgi:hypothetical protein